MRRLKKGWLALVTAPRCVVCRLTASFCVTGFGLCCREHLPDGGTGLRAFLAERAA